GGGQVADARHQVGGGALVGGGQAGRGHRAGRAGRGLGDAPGRARGAEGERGAAPEQGGGRAGDGPADVGGDYRARRRRQRSGGRGQGVGDDQPFGVDHARKGGGQTGQAEAVHGGDAERGGEEKAVRHPAENQQCGHAGHQGAQEIAVEEDLASAPAVQQSA